MADAEVRWHDIGPVTSMCFEPAHVVLVAGRRIAVFPMDDTYAALDDICPHAGASLGDGWVNNGVVSCPLHGWEFDLRTGRCPYGDEWSTEAFAVCEEEGRLLVGIPPGSER